MTARFALGVMGWSPESFWAATPGDLRLACEGRFPVAGDVAASRDDLAELMRRFPDQIS
nr:phage tail assembly chaperone [Govania unica]